MSGYDMDRLIGDARRTAAAIAAKGPFVPPPPLPAPKSVDPKVAALLLAADRALEACGLFLASQFDPPHLASAKALKREALALAGRTS